MDKDISVGPIFNDDCQQIVDLILPIQQIEFNVAITLEAQLDLLDVEGFYHKGGGGFWGAKVKGVTGGGSVEEGGGPAAGGGQLVGTIALIDIGHHAGALRKMFVNKDFRGKEMGIAQRLLEMLTGHCREKGITDVYLGSVDVMKAAHRFYERNGFTRIAMEDLPVYFPRMPADNVFYHLHLDLTKNAAQ
jgi:GNAT superfamily N-acetyltransferase